MRIGTIIVILIVVIGAGIVVMHSWQRGATTEAQYQPAPAFTPEDQLFVQKSLDLIQSAIALDEKARANSSNESIRSFAGVNLIEQHRLLDGLEDTIAAIDSDFVFPLPESMESWDIPAGRSFDRAYLQEFIQTHEQSLSMLEDASTVRNNPSLRRFAVQWSSAIHRYLSEANALLKSVKES